MTSEHGTPEKKVAQYSKYSISKREERDSGIKTSSNSIDIHRDVINNFKQNVYMYVDFYD